MGGEAADGAVETLVAAGVVDREFVAAQAGTEFADDVAAARHVLSRGSVSPHPLLDLATIPRWVREGLRAGRPGELLRFLTIGGRDKPLSPAFDAADVAGSATAKAAHRAGALGLFLDAADDASPLPGRPDLPYGRLRDALLTHARLVAGQRRLMRSRVSPDWDERAEQQWKEQWLEITPPAPGPDGAPVVSVVMPVRNRAQVVGTAIASLVAQTLEAWELVVVDDGSVDQTAAVLEQWAARDPRVRVLHQPPGGVCAARNLGLASCRGRYVAFLDSDNTYRPDFLQLAVTAMSSQDLPVSYAALVQRMTADQDQTVYRAFDGGLAELLVLNHIDLNVLVVDRELALAVGGFDPSLRRWVDHDFVLRLAREVDLTYLPFVAVDYDNARDAPDRISTTEPASWQWVVLERHLVDWKAVVRSAPERVPGRLSVIVPTWNDSQMTIRTVESLIRHRDGADLEVVVVDNGSRMDFALSLAAAFAGRAEIRLERSPRNLHYAVGSNLGFSRSTGEFVCFLHNDAEVQAGWWRPLVAELADPDVLGVSPLLMDRTTGVVWSAGLEPMRGTAPAHQFAGASPDVLDGPRRVEAVSSTALVMRAADVVALRGFDAGYVDGLEDVDLCLRAAELRPGRFVVTPASRVTHAVGRTVARLPPGWMVPNLERFQDRWAQRWGAADPEGTDAPAVQEQPSAVGGPHTEPAPVTSGEVDKLRAQLHSCRLELAQVREQQEQLTEERNRARRQRAETQARLQRLSEALAGRLDEAEAISSPRGRSRGLLRRSGSDDDYDEDDVVRRVAASPLMAAAWYLRKNPAVAGVGLSAARHYVRFGAAQGLDPGPEFSTSDYLRRHPELTGPRTNPLLHHLRAQAGQGSGP